eukprot:tig00020943_g16318.t1
MTSLLDRDLKRPRLEAAAASAGSEQPNPFEHLPDEIVLRIFSELEALDAFECSKLWKLDRRFRRLCSSVEWKCLRIGGGDPEHETFVFPLSNAAPRLPDSRSGGKELRRMAERVRRGTMRGVRRLAISPVGVDMRKMDKAKVDALNECRGALKDLISALAGAPVPLEEVSFSRERFNLGYQPGWPSQPEQLAAGAQSSADFASSALSALLPCATVRTLAIDSREISRVALNPADSERIAQAWPELRSLSFGVYPHWLAVATHRYSERPPGSALLPLARLAHLEELRVSADPDVDSGLLTSILEPLLAALAAGPGAARLRSLAFVHHEPVPYLLRHSLAHVRRPFVFGCGGPASISKLSGLRSLTIGLSHRSAPLLDGIAGIESLRHLTLYFDGAGPDEGREAFLAAAAALARAAHLEELRLTAEGPELDGPALAALVRAARPLLTQLAVECGQPSAELFEVLPLVRTAAELTRGQEAGRGGPKLACASFRNRIKSRSLRALDPFAALARGPRNGTAYDLAVHVTKKLVEEAQKALDGMLRTRPDIGLIVFPHR